MFFPKKYNHLFRFVVFQNRLKQTATAEIKKNRAFVLASAKLNRTRGSAKKSESAERERKKREFALFLVFAERRTVGVCVCLWDVCTYVCEGVSEYVCMCMGMYVGVYVYVWCVCTSGCGGVCMYVGMYIYV